MALPPNEKPLPHSFAVSGVFDRVSSQRGLSWQRLTDDQSLANRYAWCAKLATLDPVFASGADWALLQEWFGRTTLPAGDRTAVGTAKAGWLS